MTTNDILLIIGVSLCLLAVILRGMHQENLRAAALRRQTARQARMAGNEDTLNANAPAPHPLVLRLPLIYRTTLIIGFVTTLYAYWKR
jgi:hypothetical protein